MSSVDVTIFIYYYNVKINSKIRMVIMLIDKMREEVVIYFNYDVKDNHQTY